MQFTRLTFAVSALLVSGGLAAQTFKCVNSLGRITYSERKCSDLGLKDAGEVKDQIQTTPAYKPPAPGERAQQQRPAASAPAAQARPPEPSPATEEAASPDRRCFVVKTAKGNVTRCNDTPPDSPPPDSPPPN